MKILHLTDIHGCFNNINAIPELPDSDIVVLSGDITHFGHRRDITTALEFINHKHILAVSGNCDYPDVDEYLTEKNLNLNGIRRNYKNFEFIGLSGSLPCPGKTPFEFDEEYFQNKLTDQTKGLVTSPPTILVSHQPPYHTKADRILFGVHVGSKAIRLFIEEFQPLLVLTGHIHEGRSIDLIGKTKIVNPGPFRNGAYAIIDIQPPLPINAEIKKI